jgi:PAS domain S-box-containing protein
MGIDLRVLAEDYVASLRDFVDGGGEEALERARELGVAVLEGGAGVADLALIGSHAIGILLLSAAGSDESVAIIAAASRFFAEALSPLELTQEGFREALETLGRLNAVLERDVSSHLRTAREADARLGRVLELVEDRVLLVDGEGRVTAASRSVEKLLGRSVEDIVGGPLADLVVGPVEALLRPAGDASAPAGRAVELALRRGDGSEVAVVVTVSRLRHFDRSELIVLIGRNEGGGGG